MKCKGIKKTDPVLQKDGENGIYFCMCLIISDIFC